VKKQSFFNMERIDNLYEKIISIENLQLADLRARRDKEQTYGVKLHDKNREANIMCLHEMLRNKTYRTSEYHVFKVFEPKERDIYRLPFYPDRILHHAIMNILEPIWVKVFICDTFACIKKRGINLTRQKVSHALKDARSTKYCLKIDVRKFYPSIDHEVMKRIVRKKIKCEDTLELLDHIIDSADGLPIGNYLSQYLANLYLAYFDHVVKEVYKVKGYFRYADDMVFLNSSKTFLHNLLENVKDYFDKFLNLVLKSNFQIFNVLKRGIDFVGYVFHHGYTLLRKTIKKTFCRVVAALNKLKEITFRLYKMKIAPWLGWVKYCNCKNLLKTIIKPEFYNNIYYKLYGKFSKL
jgi:hypothetical protein